MMTTIMCGHDDHQGGFVGAKGLRRVAELKVLKNRDSN
jgi:hypothetical protein